MVRKVMPTTWFIVLLIIIIAVQFIIPDKRIIPFPFNHLGWIFIVAGVVLNLWTDNLFKKLDTTVKPYLKPSHFITNGPFSISRNPMYLGMLIILTGTAILFKSIILLIPAFLYIVVMNLFYIKKEEANLMELFGDEYLKYKNKVRQWI